MRKIKGFGDFIRESNSYSLDPKKEDPKISKDFNFHLIPGGNNNYRSSQMNSSILPRIISKYGIKNIVRLNRDGEDCVRDNEETPISLEKSICKEAGCNFYPIDLEGEYRKTKDPKMCVSKIDEILSRGNTLVHCKYGKDRTGGSVAFHLMNSGIMEDKDDLWKYTTKYNEWNDLIRDGEFFGTPYEIFASLFYPPKELKRSKWVKQKDI